MADFLDGKVWQYLKLAGGALLVLLGLALPFILEPAGTAKMAQLEVDGVTRIATVTDAKVSDHQAARPYMIGSTAPLRRLGLSRKAAFGVAVLQNRRAMKKHQATDTFYDIEYEFAAGGEEVVAGQVHLQLPDADTLVSGSEISVLHDPREPRIHRLPDFSKPTHATSNGLKFGSAMLSMVLGGLLIAWGWPRSDDATLAATAFAGRALPETASVSRVTRVAVAPSTATLSGPRRTGFGPAASASKGFGPRARA